MQQTDYPTAFVVMAAIILVPLGLIPGFRTGEPLGHHSLAGNDETVMAQFRRLATDRLLLRTGILQVVAMGCQHSFLVFLIVLLVKELGYSSQVVSLIVAAQGVGSVLVMFRGGNLAERFPMHEVYLVCFLMQIFGLATAGYSGRLWLIGVGAVSLAMGAGLLMATSYSQLGRMAGKKGKIAAIFFLLTGIWIAVSPLYSGWLAAVNGTRAAFIGFIPLEVAVLGYLAVIWSTEKRRNRQENDRASHRHGEADLLSTEPSTAR